jgi:Nif-specific regulatory protein
MVDATSSDPSESRASAAEDPKVARLRRERDLFARLLELTRCRDVIPLLRDGLMLIAETVGARQGYLELLGETHEASEPRWWIAHGFTDAEIADVRKLVSRGIIGETIAQGQTIATASAFLDPRFSALESVRRGKIEAVLCAPIAVDPPRGVLYLQGRSAGGKFSEDDRLLAETFCQNLAPLVESIGERREPEDATAAVRTKLRLVNFIGRSPALATLLEQVALVAPLDISVLLTGDTGTGKSELARVVHDNSKRVGKPFVELNCAALPEALVESELFGALPGAHSTATQRMYGKVAAAEHGTLFLDEIGDLSLPAQAKLLQLLQSKQYYPLGSARAETADVRLIAATNADLLERVAERRFREDLLYRLQVLPIRVPSLAERREDLVQLAAFFCTSASDRHGLARVSVSPAALRAVEALAWPGNVRQLAHVVEAAVIRAAGEGAQQVEPRHLFPERGAVAGSGEPTEISSFQDQTRRFQATLVRETLDACDWSVVDAARRLDLARSHIYKLIRAFGLERSRK